MVLMEWTNDPYSLSTACRRPMANGSCAVSASNAGWLRWPVIRWQLRGAVKVVNRMLGMLGLEKHPDKTFIGRIERGFDFLGYHFGPAGLTVAAKTIANFIEKASRLYEQERSAVLAATALEMYVRRWGIAKSVSSRLRR